MSERRHWCQNGKPLVVMDEPTEEHIKALMMTWVRRDPKHVMLSELTPDKRDAIGQALDDVVEAMNLEATPANRLVLQQKFDAITQVVDHVLGRENAV